MVEVRITDPNASKQYPFEFELGDTVESKLDGTPGKIVDGVYNGLSGSGSYEIIYTVGIENGSGSLQFFANEDELRKI